jgi:hypothetical protein
MASASLLFMSSLLLLDGLGIDVPRSVGGLSLLLLGAGVMSVTSTVAFGLPRMLVLPAFRQRDAFLSSVKSR